MANPAPALVRRRCVLRLWPWPHFAQPLKASSFGKVGLCAVSAVQYIFSSTPQLLGSRRACRVVAASADALASAQAGDADAAETLLAIRGYVEHFFACEGQSAHAQRARDHARAARAHARTDTFGATQADTHAHSSARAHFPPPSSPFPHTLVPLSCGLLF
eukprot:6211092-Pleurochrysis_carterae.AAC.1